MCFLNAIVNELRYPNIHTFYFSCIILYIYAEADREIIFEQISAITASSIETEIKNVVNNFEPRVSIDNVEVVAIEDANAFYVNLSFFIGNNTSPSEVNILLERTR